MFPCLCFYLVCLWKMRGKRSFVIREVTSLLCCTFLFLFSPHSKRFTGGKGVVKEVARGRGRGKGTTTTASSSSVPHAGDTAVLGVWSRPHNIGTSGRQEELTTTTKQPNLAGRNESDCKNRLGVQLLPLPPPAEAGPEEWTVVVPRKGKGKFKGKQKGNRAVSESQGRLQQLSEHFPGNAPSSTMNTDALLTNARTPSIPKTHRKTAKPLLLRRTRELDVDPTTNMAEWNQAKVRRQRYRNPFWAKQTVSLRSNDTLLLTSKPDRRIGQNENVRRMTSHKAFSAFAVVRGTDILFERYASDFEPAQVHSMQSCTKTSINLIFGRLLAAGLVDLSHPVSYYLPAIGSGYSTATLQQVLDMNVTNSFTDGYGDVYSPAPKLGEDEGYSRMEISMGWRLPPVGERPSLPLKEYLSRIQSADIRNNSDGYTQYKSTNTEVLAWVCSFPPSLPNSPNSSITPYMAPTLPSSSFPKSLLPSLTPSPPNSLPRRSRKLRPAVPLRPSYETWLRALVWRALSTARPTVTWSLFSLVGASSPP